MSESSSIGDPPCDSVVIVLSKSGQVIQARAARIAASRSKDPRAFG